MEPIINLSDIEGIEFEIPIILRLPLDEHQTMFSTITINNVNDIPNIINSFYDSLFQPEEVNDSLISKIEDMSGQSYTYEDILNMRKIEARGENIYFENIEYNNKYYTVVFESYER